jgi:hypothetical protein
VLGRAGFLTLEIADSHQRSELGEPFCGAREALGNL